MRVFRGLARDLTFAYTFSTGIRVRGLHDGIFHKRHASSSRDPRN